MGLEIFWAQGWNASPDYVREVIATKTAFTDGGAIYIGFGYDHVVMLLKKDGYFLKITK